MADRDQTADDDGGEDETLELTDVADDAEQGDEGNEDAPKKDEEDEDELVVGFADEQPEEEPDAGNKTIRQMRETLKERERELKELRAKVAPAPKVERKPKPTLEDCDYDADVFERELLDWKDAESKADAVEAEAEQQQKAVQESWQQAAQRYAARKAELGADFTDAEDALDRALGPQLSPVLLKAAKDPAAVVLALGKSPARLAELQKIKDPIELAAEIARLEGGVKVERRKRTPALDRPAGGSGTGTLSSTEATLKRLEDEAERTGDRSKLVAYKSKLNKKL